MNWIMNIAFRNIRRNKRRTILAVVSIALAVALTTYMNGFLGGILANMVKNITKNETGHILITTKGFEERSRFMPLDEFIYDGEAIRSSIEGIGELENQVDRISERILFGTLLTNGNNSVAALAIAADAKTEKELLNLDRSIVQGRYIEGPRETILGKKAAEDLGLIVGDTLKVLTQGADYSLRLRSFTIVGIFASGLSQLDGSVFQIPLEDAKDFLRTDGGVQQILVMLKDYSKADHAAALIRGALSDREELLVRSWTTIGEYPRLIEMMKVMYGFIYIIISFLGAIIISNILMMVVLERRREIGILKSMGLKKRDILALFVSEGAAMGALGSAIGAILGLGFCILNSIYGFDFSTAFEGINLPLDPIYYAEVNPLAAVVMFVIGTTVSVGVSILPSRRAALMNAVDAIKSVA